MILSATIAALFLAIWFAKYKRDQRIIAEAYEERQAFLQNPPQPPMTSKGSRRLFIPPPTVG